MLVHLPDGRFPIGELMVTYVGKAVTDANIAVPHGELHEFHAVRGYLVLDLFKEIASLIVANLKHIQLNFAR